MCIRDRCSQDIFRKYPNRYERVISTLCENLETLDEPEAKASMIWIIGECSSGWALNAYLYGWVIIELRLCAPLTSCT